MNYTEVIRTKNRVLAITLLICIVLRAIVNGFYVGIGQVLIYTAGGLVLTGILLALSIKMPPVVQMYLMVVLMSIICYVLMIAFPCTTNYLMFFLAIFFVVIYEDIRPIILQTVLCAIGMVVFYLKYTQELADTWTSDAMAMCIVYLVSGMLVYLSLCRMTKMQFKKLAETSRISEEAKGQAEGLLTEIGKSVSKLETAGSLISESVETSGEISNQIAIATDDVAKRTQSEVDSVEAIRRMVEDGVSQIKQVSESSNVMAESSNATNEQLIEGTGLVEDLAKQMELLNQQMEKISESVANLNNENTKIGNILAALDEITSQTNLLSLNASIEAARAGEHGKGFAVVANEIRQLSDNSAQFSEQIKMILSGITNQTAELSREIEDGHKSVEQCAEHAKAVDESFVEIHSNTKQVLEQAMDVHEKSENLAVLMNETLDDVNHINENIESTSSAMEEVASSIMDLHGNIDSVVSGYKEINEITGALVSASASTAEPTELN